MRILVLGASGGVGSWVVRLAVERGHQVTAMARPTARLDAPAGVRVIRAEATDAGAVDEAVRDHDAVVSCLGQRRAGPSPRARLLSPPDLTERVTRLLVPAMHRHGVTRVVAISAGGVADSFEQLGRPVRWLVRSGNVAVAYRDLARMEAELAASGLDWLAVRPVTLVHGSPTGRARPVTRYGLTSRIRRADVAHWIVEAVAAPAPFVQRTVLLGS